MTNPGRKVVYLTGPPAAGKTSLAEALRLSYGASVYSYGALLTERIRAARDQEQLRSLSAELVEAADVEDLDAELVALIGRSDAELIVIDSHAVTKEAWGFRVVPYASSAIGALGITHIVCLYSSPETITARITKDPSGRPLPSASEIASHQHLQNSLALAYSHSLGVPVYFVANDQLVGSTVDSVAKCCSLPLPDPAGRP